MKYTWKKLIVYGCSALALTSYDALSAVLSGEERSVILDRGNSILNRKVLPLDSEEIDRIGNRFSAPSVPERVEEVKEIITPESASEVLDILSKDVNPTGVFVLGGSYILMFKEKRVRVNETVRVAYNNKEYDLIVSKIQSNSFTLRYKDAELNIKLN